MSSTPAPEAKADDVVEPEHEALVLDTPTDAPLAVKIAHAMAEAGRVTKSRQNTDQGYKFAGAEAILAAVRLPLLKRGVMLKPEVTSVEEEAIESRGGAKGTRVKLGVRFTFTDGADELVADWVGEGQDYGDKAYGKAYTNAIKTYVRVAWLLPTEHDDAEASPSGERVARAAAAELPAWAKFVDTDDAKRAVRDDVVALFTGLGAGEEEAKALTRNYLGTWVRAFGDGVPFGVSAVLRALADYHRQPPAARQAAEAQRIAQDAAAEQPDAPAPEPTSDVPADPGEFVDPAVEAELARQEAAAAEGGPPPATAEELMPPVNPATSGRYEKWVSADTFVEDLAKALGQTPSKTQARDALKAAGCLCEDPLDPTRASDACPFLDHGIPF